MSLYADDATIFIRPTTFDVEMTRHIPNLFGQASGLVTNMNKIEFYPIRCHNIDVQEIVGVDQGLSSLPCNYLGLPLHVKKLPKS